MLREGRRRSAADVVYHYSRGWHLSEIFRTGSLRPSDAMIEPRERPALWFTTSPVWEPVVGPVEDVRRVGLVRFVVKAEKIPGLMTFDTWARRARVSRLMVDIQRKYALKLGSNPHDHCATFAPLPLDAVDDIQISTDGVEWRQLTDEDCAWLSSLADEARWNNAPGVRLSVRLAPGA